MKQIRQIIDKFIALPILKQAGVVLGLLVLIGYLFNTFVYSGPSQELTKLEEDIEGLRSNINKEKNIAKNLAKYQEEVRNLDRKLQLVLQELPDEKQIPAFLQSVADLAVETGLDVSEFNQQGEEINEFFASVPVNMQLQGTFHKLATFFDEVAHLDRIINIHDINIDITGEKDGEITIKSNCIATTFRYLTDAEVAAQTAGDSAEEGGGRTRSN